MLAHLSPAYEISGLEIDSYPDRQDLDSELLLLARDTGVRLAIDTDAHRGSQFEFVELGLASALEAGIPAERIVNFMPREQLLAWVSQVRSKAGLLS